MMNEDRTISKRVWIGSLSEYPLRCEEQRSDLAYLANYYEDTGINDGAHGICHRQKGMLFTIAALQERKPTPDLSPLN